MEPDLRATGPGQRLRIGVNALCFGVASAFIAHEVFLEAEPWGGVLASLYAVTAAIGVTRSKVEPDRRSKSTTQGLPPFAGGSPVGHDLPVLHGGGGSGLCWVVFRLRKKPVG